MTDALNDEILEAARAAGDQEALLRQVARLRGALDQILPLARRFAAVAPEHGGPDADHFVANPDDAEERVLPEILEGELALFSTGTAEMPLAESAGFDQHEPDDFIDTEDEDEPTADPDTLEALMLQAVSLLRAMNAHRIAGEDPPEDIQERYAGVLNALAERLASRNAGDR